MRQTPLVRAAERPARPGGRRAASSHPKRLGAVRPHGGAGEALQIPLHASSRSAVLLASAHQATMGAHPFSQAARCRKGHHMASRPPCQLTEPSPAPARGSGGGGEARPPRAWRDCPLRNRCLKLLRPVGPRRAGAAGAQWPRLACMQRWGSTGGGALSCTVGAGRGKCLPAQCVRQPSVLRHHLRRGKAPRPSA